MPDDLDAAIEESHRALSAIVKGDVEPFLTLYSPREDVTLGNPFRTVRSRYASGS